MTTQERALGPGISPRTGRPEASPPPADRRSRWQRLTANRNFRRAFGCMIAFLVLAVMLGPEGSATAPLSGLTGSLFTPRVLIFVGLGVALALRDDGPGPLRRAHPPAERQHHRCPEAPAAGPEGPLRLLRRRSRARHSYPDAHIRLLAGCARPANRDIRAAGTGSERGRRLCRPARPRLRRLLRHRRIHRGVLVRRPTGASSHPPEHVLDHPLRRPGGHAGRCDTGDADTAPTRRLPGHRDPRLWRDHRDRGHEPGRVHGRGARGARHPALSFQPARPPLHLGHCATCLITTCSSASWS